MAQSSSRRERRQELLRKHPSCYFCGGANPATEIDHVPPEACFPDGYAPESFESPACKPCNEGTTRQDQIFGLYSMVLDFDESKMRQPEHLKKVEKLKQGVINNYPEALADATKAIQLNRVGSLITPHPVAISVPTTPLVKDAVQVMGRKLIHALYLREVGEILTPAHQFVSLAYQPQREGTQGLTELLTTQLPNAVRGKRPNITGRKYGDRFGYKFICKEDDDFFLYIAQFGHGIVFWGIVCGPKMERPRSGPLGSAPWLSGGCGPGADYPHSD